MTAKLDYGTVLGFALAAIVVLFYVVMFYSFSKADGWLTLADFATAGLAVGVLAILDGRLAKRTPISTVRRKT